MSYEDRYVFILILFIYFSPFTFIASIFQQNILQDIFLALTDWLRSRYGSIMPTFWVQSSTVRKTGCHQFGNRRQNCQVYHVIQIYKNPALLWNNMHHQFLHYIKWKKKTLIHSKHRCVFLTTKTHVKIKSQ